MRIRPWNLIPHRYVRWDHCDRCYATFERTNNATRVRDAAVWLPVTPDTGPRPAHYAPPRVCAGRATLTERVRSFYDLAEATAAAKLPAWTWPAAPEGHTA